MPVKTLVIGGVCGLIFLACSQNSQISTGPTWPQSDPKVSISESRYADMGLRVLALELNREMGGRSQYFLEFLPRMGKIEGRVQLLDVKPTQDKTNQSALAERLKQEISLVEAGVREILGQVSLQSGFDPKANLEIRFDAMPPQGKNLAIYKDGEILWF